MIDKPFDEVTADDLKDLIARGVQEGLRLEYKETLPGVSPEDVREFLADVTAFANTAGGDILYGVREVRDEAGKQTGVPEELVGVQCNNHDQVIQRMNNILRDSVEPRITGCRLLWRNVAPETYVLHVRVPRSWSGPHVVNHRGHWRFYRRNSCGKHPMDLSEVREAMVFADGLGQRLTNFRFDRLAKIEAGETPSGLIDRPIIVLHLIPFGSVHPAPTVDLGQLAPQDLPLIYGDLVEKRMCFDGVYTSVPREAALGYVLVLRNGALEAVDSALLGWSDAKPLIPAFIRRELLKATTRYLGVLRKLHEDSPLLWCLSLLGVRGYEAQVDPISADKARLARSFRQVDRDNLILPPVLMEHLSIADVEVAVASTFDMIWNAAGWDEYPTRLSASS